MPPKDIWNSLFLLGVLIFKNMGSPETYTSESSVCDTYVLLICCFFHLRASTLRLLNEMSLWPAPTGLFLCAWEAIAPIYVKIISCNFLPEVDFILGQSGYTSPTSQSSVFVSLDVYFEHVTSLPLPYLSASPCLSRVANRVLGWMDQNTSYVLICKTCL